MGMLVEALWDRGIEAHGVDLSPYAISQVRPDMRPYCRVGSLTEPIEGRYDLVTCIEVLEHMPHEEASIAIDGLTGVTDTILFSSSPVDFNEPTHFNVQPPIAWLKMFADHGFWPDLGFDATFISPQAFLVRRRTDPLPDDVLAMFAQLVLSRVTRADVERRLSSLSSEKSRLSADFQEVDGEHRQLRGEYQRLGEEYRRLREEQQSLHDERQRLREEHRLLTDNLEQAERRLGEVESSYVQLKKDQEATLASRNRLNAQLDEAAGRIEFLEHELTKTISERGEAVWEATSIAEELASLRHSHQLLIDRLRRLELERNSALEIVGDLDRRLTETGGIRSTLEEQIDSITGSPGWSAVRRYRRFLNEYLGAVPTLKYTYEAVIGNLLRSFAGGGGGRATGKTFTPHVGAAGSEVRPSTNAVEAPQRYLKPAAELHSSLLPHLPHRLPDRLAVLPHERPASIIICVHNALDDLRQCLSSVVRFTFPPYELILVDDGSGPETRDYLREFASGQGARLIRNESAVGYTRAANQGLRAASGDYLVLLNSDTIVAEDWLDRLVMCADSDPQIGLVGPLSNTASWQSVPNVVENGDWAANEIPEGRTVNDVAGLVARNVGRAYPRIGFLNGFCLLVKREVIEQVGYFDEDVFGEGYGEENDYCVRVRKAGLTPAVADDTYVYHLQSRSYSHERRKSLVRRSDPLLRDKHGDRLVDEGLRPCVDGLPILGVRARARAMYSRAATIEKARERWEGRRIAFILPVSQPGGGANVVLSEAAAMRRFGLDVQIVNLKTFRPYFRKAYPRLGLRVSYASGPDEIPDLVSEFDAVVATACASVHWLQPLSKRDGGPRLGYYVQDYEPWFFAEGSAERDVATRSYAAIPEIVSFTKTSWTRDTVLSLAGVDCRVVGPSCDFDTFRPRNRRAEAKGPIGVCAMIRPETARRGPAETMRLLAELSRQYGGRVAIRTFGVASDDPGFMALPTDFEFTNYGVLTSEQTALFLNEQDIFLDLSHFQAMGLTSMEAMATGLAVVVPRAGGCSEFVRHGENGIVVDTRNEVDCLRAVSQLIEDPAQLLSLRQRAVEDIVAFSPEQAGYNILDCLFPQPE